MATRGFRQVLIARQWFGPPGVDPGYRYQLEILKARQRTGRRSYAVVGEAAAIAAALFAENASFASWGVLLDYLTDHPECVIGLDAATIREAIEAVREYGGWFVGPKRKMRG